MNAYLRELLQDSGYPMNTTSELEIVRDVKERLASLAKQTEKKKYELPDGTFMELQDELQCAQILFEPKKMGIDKASV